MAVDPACAKGTEPKLLLKLYREALRVRMIEEEIATRYAEGEMRCPVHLSIGQEGVAVGVCAALNPDDAIVSNHRCHAHYLAKRGDLKAMLGELYGRATGCCGGRGGSMHLVDRAAGVLASLPIVAGSIPIGVGVGLALQRQGTRRVCVIFFGDAALEEGTFHESANFAALKKLPVVFVCENNLYSVYTSLAQRQLDRPLRAVAAAHGLVTEAGDGNDVGEVYRLATAAIAHARSGKGASFLELRTYRWREHCGPNYDNDLGYRTVEEFEWWRERCPIKTLETKLASLGVLESATKNAIMREISEEISEAFEFARSSPRPEPNTAGRYVYA